MALWDKVRTELASAGRAAQGAIDEGKVRLEAFRARQRADKAAQSLGYAVYRAKQQNRELEPETMTRLSAALAEHEAEAARHEKRLDEMSKQRDAKGGAVATTEEPKAQTSGDPPVNPS